MQEPGERVYISIKQPPDKKPWFQVKIHELMTNASNAFYILDTKRVFGTSRNKADERVDENTREFIFKKLRPDDLQSILEEGEESLNYYTFASRSIKFATRPYSIKKFEFVKGSPRSYYDCETDPESSDYSDSEGAGALVEKMGRLGTKEEGE